MNDLENKIQTIPKDDLSRPIDIDRKLLEKCIKESVSYLRMPMSLSCFDKYYESPEDPKVAALLFIAIDYAERQFPTYNNFWTRIRDSAAIMDFDTLIEKNGISINSLDGVAREELGNEYSGKIELKEGMTMKEVYKHYLNMFENSRNIEPEIKNERICSLKESIAYEENQKQLFNDINKTCTGLGYGSVVEVWKQLSIIKGESINTAFKKEKRISGYELLNSEIENIKRMHYILKPILDIMIKKGYSEDICR